MQAIATIEIRYRRSDTVGAWSPTITLPAGQQTCQIDGLQRGLTYQIEARAIGTNGSASIWVQQTHVVADASQLPIAPTSLTALSVADGVHLSWSVTGTQRADVEYDVERTNDIGGSPNPIGWTNIANIKATAYTDGITDGVVRWYRVRAVDFQELASAYSNDVNSNNKSVQDGADVTNQQAIVYAGSSESIVPNGNFVLRNTQGWLVPGFVYDIDGNGPRIYSNPSNSSGAFSPSFNIVPGQKYRVNYKLYNGSGSGGIYLRLAFQPTYAPVVSVPAAGAGFVDFMANGSVTTTPTLYTYDFVCPPGQFYASLAIYAVGGSDLACQFVSCIPYSAAGEWGADVTFNNTADNTNNVGTLPAGDVTSTVNPGGGIDFSNPGNTNNTMDYIGDGSGRYAAIETGADKTLNHVLTTAAWFEAGGSIDPAALTEVPGMSWSVISNDLSDVFNISGTMMWSTGMTGPGADITVIGMVDGERTKQFGWALDVEWTGDPSKWKNFPFVGSCSGLAPGSHIITLYYFSPNGSALTVSGGYSQYAVLQQISS